METLLLTLLAVAIVIVVVSATVYLWIAIQQKRIALTQSQWTLFRWIVSEAVWVAEKAWRSGVIQKDERLNYAVKWVQDELIAHGIPAVLIEKIKQTCAVIVDKEFNQARLVQQPELLSAPVTSSLDDTQPGY